MKAVMISRYGAPDVLTSIDADTPVSGPDDVLIEVAAAAVNPVDLAVRRGVIPVQRLPAIVGWDVAGKVVATGVAVTRFHVGDRVIAARSPFAHGDGVTADYVALAETLVAHAPAGMPLAHAAALPLSALTAAQALALLGDGFSGRVLVTGAAGSVGGYALELAGKRGWPTAGFARTADTDLLHDLGTAEAFSDTRFPPAAAFDAVVDTAGMPDMMRAVRDGGRFIAVTPAAVPEPERSISVELCSVETDGVMLDALARRVERGELTLRVARTFPFSAACDAHALLEVGGTRGKVLLTPDPQ